MDTQDFGYGAGVVSSLLQEIKRRNKDDQLSQLISRACEVSIGQEKYVDECTFPETSLQAKIVADTMADSVASEGFVMITGHPEGNYLRFLAEMVQAKSILEIGMYTGYGAVSLAESAYCEEVVTLDVEPYYEKFLTARLAGTPIENKVRIMIAPAQESLVKLKEEGKTFDFIFIDSYKRDYLGCYQYIMDNELLSARGVIACDNVLLFGNAFNRGSELGEVVHDFVEFVKNDDRVIQIMLPVRDGILLVRRKVTVGR